MVYEERRGDYPNCGFHGSSVYYIIDKTVEWAGAHTLVRGVAVRDDDKAVINQKWKNIDSFFLLQIIRYSELKSETNDSNELMRFKFPRYDNDILYHYTAASYYYYVMVNKLLPSLY